LIFIKGTECVTAVGIPTGFERKAIHTVESTTRGEINLIACEMCRASMWSVGAEFIEEVQQTKQHTRHCNNDDKNQSSMREVRELVASFAYSGEEWVFHLWFLYFFRHKIASSWIATTCGRFLWKVIFF